MKKLISIVLVFVMLLSVALVPAFAENTVSDEKDYYYWCKDEFEEKYGEAIVYNEWEYYPYDLEEYALEWLFIEAVTERVASDSGEEKCYINGDVVIHEKDTLKPFNTPYCVYDVSYGGGFIDVTKVDFKRFPKAKDILLRNDLAIRIGDLNDNKVVNILDVTQLQCVLASLAELEVCECVADFNRDGAYDILDATAIQLKLAGIK